jgi:hypothetical protein
MPPKKGRVAKRALRRRKAPRLLAEQASGSHQASSSNPSVKAKPTLEATEECILPNLVLKKSRRDSESPKRFDELPSESHQASGSKPSLGGKSILEATDECVPPICSPGRRTSPVTNPPFSQQSLSSGGKNECDFEGVIGGSEKLSESPTQTRLLDHCLTTIRENNPLLGFQDSTPLGGTVWDGLYDMENILAKETSEDPMVYSEAEAEVESKGIKQLNQIEQAKSVLPAPPHH